jgi:hypothetical protein
VQILKRITTSRAIKKTCLITKTDAAWAVKIDTQKDLKREEERIVHKKNEWVQSTLSLLCSGRLKA